MKKVYIYGTGVGARLVIKELKEEAVEIVGYIDDACNENEFLNKNVIRMQEIKNQEFDLILITTLDDMKTYEEFIELGIEKSKLSLLFPKKIIKDANAKLSEGLLNQDKIKDILPRWNRYAIIQDSYRVSKFLENDISQEEDDYVRTKTLMLAAKAIQEYKVEGEVAEVGVYKGEFAKHINRIFKDKKLYLFDTFEGFPEEDKKQDLEKEYYDKYHLNTWDMEVEIKEVLAKMEAPENCIIKKGYFPDTAEGLEEKFAFVSIDVDLYKPIYSALEYFYPRLSKGGYIFIHDYNDSGFMGVKEALKDFERKYGTISKVPIPDNCGSIVVCK